MATANPVNPCDTQCWVPDWGCSCWQCLGTSSLAASGSLWIWILSWILCSPSPPWKVCQARQTETLRGVCKWSLCLSGRLWSYRSFKWRNWPEVCIRGVLQRHWAILWADVKNKDVGAFGVHVPRCLEVFSSLLCGFQKNLKTTDIIIIQKRMHSMDAENTK